ncbi:CRISPR-associated RecB family exonuclease Cas4b / CRISPR-associated protein Cas1 [Rhodovulum sp. PH10]|uniref:CRISPR-associated endonuclease Cas4/Cas1 n=1 Tax=Rhodovulum sp. PH10 TaxID=1187851 RepID=UPI00027C2CF8|nr:CRISPR-associated endonuclease Cas4/Cas1 [Rhodovulum sp. PH10]EJW11567.1 CRISPR-associated RecB family exonuclease Cas4b / CRISPR-associated protein Cas1 [Rhodovulum sp. PH10]
MSTQLSFDLPAPPATSETPLVPVRMVNEWVFCPRLAFLEWVDGEWADSGDTEEGRRAHVRVDAGGGTLPAAETVDEKPDFSVRSVTLASEKLGIVGKMDLVEGEDGAVTPVDTKKGKRPHVAEGAYAPERVQVCAQALILEDAGYRVSEGAIWYAGSRERVRIALDDVLRGETRTAISQLRLAAAAGKLPPPLADSPKCTKCSLAGICLPDEVSFFRKGVAPRPLNPSAEAALPLYVQEPGARVRKSGEVLVIETDEQKSEVPIGDVSELVLHGPVSVTGPTVTALLREEIPVTWASAGGWVLGHTVSTGHRNVSLRIAQYRAAFDERRALAFARTLVAAKIRNARVFLRRNFKAGDEAARDGALEAMVRLADRAQHAPTEAELLGLEGEAAARYFRLFETMLGEAAREFPAFAFEKRTRRPPADPVNAMLSFGYALLTRTWHTVLSAVGFDPYLGFYHKPRFGRAALALDMMEPFRPILSDSTVIQVINNGEVKPDGFVAAGPAVNLKPPAKRAFIAAYERRLDQEVTHPVFGYRVSMRRLLEVQARLLGRWLAGEIDDYPHYLVR